VPRCISWASAVQSREEASAQWDSCKDWTASLPHIVDICGRHGASCVELVPQYAALRSILHSAPHHPHQRPLSCEELRKEREYAIGTSCVPLLRLCGRQ